MNEYNQNSSSSSSLQQLLKKLENCISLESSRNANPWVSVARLTELFYEKYRVSLEKAAKAQGYKDGLKSLLNGSRRFVIYSTQLPQEFYIALFQEIFPGFQQSRTTSIQYRIKQPWKVDEHLPYTLKVEGAEEISSYEVQKTSKYQPILVSEIKSLNDLELALIEIIKSLTANDQKKFITLAILSRKFCDYYKQPIRPILRSVCPDMKLIELLQAIPSLHVQKVENDWYITLNY